MAVIRPLEAARIGLVFLGILIVAAYFARLDPDWHHDGILFKPAVDVAAGLSLFKETFTQYGALTTYLQAGAIAIFGKYLIVLRFQAALFVALIGVLLYLIVRRIARPAIAVLAVTLWALMSPYTVGAFFPWSSIFALFFVLLGTWLVIRVDPVETRHTTGLLWHFLAGLAFSAAFWSRQPYGIVFPILALYLPLVALCKDSKWRTTWQSFGSLCLGFLTLTLAGLVWLWLDEALVDWWLQSIIGAQTFAESQGGGRIALEQILRFLFPRPGMILASNGSWIWRILPILNLFIVFVLILNIAIKRRLSLASRNLLILSLVGIGTWHQYYPMSSIAHTFYGATPMIGALMGGTYMALRNLSIPPFACYAIIVSLAILLFARDIDYRVRAGLDKYSIAQVDFPTLEGMHFSNKFVRNSIRYSGTDEEYFSNLKTLGRALNNIQAISPQISLLTITEDAYLGAVFASDNPHKATVWWRWIHRMYPDHRKSLRNYIKENRPLIEIKIKRWGWDEYSWVDPQSPQRVDLGFADYEVLISTDYSDSGASQILAPPTFIALYRKHFPAQ